MSEMTSGELLELLDLVAGNYYEEAINSIIRNSHMNDLTRKDAEEMKRRPVLSQKIAEAIIVDFVNTVGVRLGGDHGLRTKHLPEEKLKNQNR